MATNVVPKGPKLVYCPNTRAPLVNKINEVFGSGATGTTNAAPTATLTTGGTSFTAPASVTLTATATDSDGTVAKVEFYNGTTLLGSDATAPYSYSWTNVAAGTYTLTARAYDNGNATGNSAAVTVTVTGTGGNAGGGCTVAAWSATATYVATNRASRNGNVYEAKWWTQGDDPLLKSGPDDVWKLIGPCGGGTGNVAPTATLTTGGTSFTAPASVTLTATAADSDGTVAKVEFYNGTTLLGSDATAPYSYSWMGVAAGTYSLTARAYDNGNATGNSATVTVTVTGSTTGTCDAGQRVVGYQPSWAGTAQEIEYDKLSHVIYAFIRPTTTGGLTAVENPQKLRDIVALAHAQGVKVLMAVGGWSDLNNADFQGMAANASYRTAFINNLVSLVNTYQLDGVDIDWEYPVAGADPANFTTLMDELGTAMHARGKLLTAAVAAYGDYANGIQTAVFADVDFLNLMVYDGGDGAAHSPYSMAVQSLDYWLGRGLPPSKAVVGVPFYGRPTWKSYRQLLTEGANPAQDVFNGVYYNGTATIKQKAELAKQRASGIMIWELSQDTHDANSLLRAINTVIKPCREGTPGNVAPVATLTAPVHNATFAANASITLTATATDSDGTVVKVEFYNGSTLLGSDATAPYAFAWSNVPAGTYTLTARATDDKGATGTLGAATVAVGGGGCTVAAWSATATYVGTNRVSRNGNVYEAKWWTQNEDPALKSGPDDVWKLIGPCGGSARSGAGTEALPRALVFPNPARTGGEVVLDLKATYATVRVTVVSALGQVVYAQTLMHTRRVAFRLPGAAAGLYQVNVVADGQPLRVSPLVVRE
jgi:GH18 family chitinase